ncbi:MAG: SPOR domain-containing protein [Treponema sp.]
MEEKKTLWIVLLVSFFVLVVFGSAMLLYHHPKTQSCSDEELRYFREISDSHGSEKIDPDLWSRELEKVPDYEDTEDANITGKRGSITFVDGATVENGKSYIDVSNLDSSRSAKEGKKLPEEVAKQLGVDENKIENKEEIAKKEESKPKDVGLVSPKNSNKQVITRKENSNAVKNDTKKVEKRDNPSSIQTVYWVQTASLSSKLNAEKARDKLVSRHMKVEIFTKETTAGLTHRVRVGPFKNNTEAEYWLKNIKEIRGFESSYISQERVRA